MALLIHVYEFNLVKMRKKIVAGNWKMNLSFEEGKNLTEEIIERCSNAKKACDVIIIPSFIHLAAVHRIADGFSVKIGSQNNYINESGAFTGEISAAMLKSVGVSYGLVGHSERRTYFNEHNSLLLEKVEALIAQNIQAIFCFGENQEDRKNKQHFTTVKEQLEILWSLSAHDFKKIILAYEPVWAIGTGKSASAEEAQEVHAFVRGLVKEKMGESAANDISILYGGSCNASNAKSIFAKPDVDGGLIGSASINIDDFMSIVKSFD